MGKESDDNIYDKTVNFIQKSVQSGNGRSGGEQSFD